MPTNAKSAITDAQPAQPPKPVSPAQPDSTKTPTLPQPQLSPVQHVYNAQHFAASARTD